MSPDQDPLSQPHLAQRERTLTRLVWALSIVVLLLVALMRSPQKIPLPDGLSLAGLPLLHATLNTLCALCLIVARLAIARRQIPLHRRAMTLALVLSSLFLLSYVTYHFTTPETRYGGQDWLRSVYFFLLISHIATAALSFPIILLSFVAAWCRNFPRHRRLVRWSYPLWLYVALTGPLCYLLLRPYYS